MDEADEDDTEGRWRSSAVSDRFPWKVETGWTTSSLVYSSFGVLKGRKFSRAVHFVLLPRIISSVGRS